MTESSLPAAATHATSDRTTPSNGLTVSGGSDGGCVGCSGGLQLGAGASLLQIVAAASASAAAAAIVAAVAAAIVATKGAVRSRPGAGARLLRNGMRALRGRLGCGRPWARRCGRGLVRRRPDRHECRVRYVLTAMKWGRVRSEKVGGVLSAISLEPAALQYLLATSRWRLEVRRWPGAYGPFLPCCRLVTLNMGRQRDQRSFVLILCVMMD